MSVLFKLNLVDFLFDHRILFILKQILSAAEQVAAYHTMEYLGAEIEDSAFELLLDFQAKLLTFFIVI